MKMLVNVTITGFATQLVGEKNEKYADRLCDRWVNCQVRISVSIQDRFTKGLNSSLLTFMISHT
jgi:hypothetical protein